MRQFCITLVMIGILVAGIMAQSTDRIEKTNWQAFGDNLINAVSSDNQGLKISAMQHMITYQKYLDVRDATFDLIRIYRLHPDERMRQLAAVTLESVGSSWGKDFLRRNLRFEKNEVIKHQILDYVYKQEKQNLAAGNQEILAERTR
jgi:hypothetical protein